MLRPLTLSLFLIAGPVAGQTDAITIELDGAKALHLSALFSNVDILSADGDEITVDHKVLVEGEPHPELGQLDIRRDGSRITVTETGPSLDQLQKLQKDRSWQDHCCNSQISMTIRVPAGVEVSVETIYGSVDVTDLKALTQIRATYGGVTVVYRDAPLPDELSLYSNYGAVDLTVPPAQPLTVELQTQFGELLTDMDLDIDTKSSERRDFFERVVGTVAGGGRASVRCEAPYGKIYLRNGAGR